jgi:hypothetical protein
MDDGIGPVANAEPGDRRPIKGLPVNQVNPPLAVFGREDVAGVGVAV